MKIEILFVLLSVFVLTAEKGCNKHRCGVVAIDHNGFPVCGGQCDHGKKCKSSAAARGRCACVEKGN